MTCLLGFVSVQGLWGSEARAVGSLRPENWGRE
jgi:hypothetical protein